MTKFCDGDHGFPVCETPQCWLREPLDPVADSDLITFRTPDGERIYLDKTEALNLARKLMDVALGDVSILRVALQAGRYLRDNAISDSGMPDFHNDLAYKLGRELARMAGDNVSSPGIWELQPTDYDFIRTLK